MTYEKLEYRIHDDGCEAYLDEDGNFHNPKGWACKDSWGTKIWYIHGKRHREDGPAVEYSDEDVEYWLNHKCLTKEEWERALRPVKEMTVAEICEALGHEVKVVK